MMKMGDVVRIAEGAPPRISSARPGQTAGEYLVSRIFTDAIFNYDIRSIINIVQRVDGDFYNVVGLPIARVARLLRQFPAGG